MVFLLLVQSLLAGSRGVEIFVTFLRVPICVEVVFVFVGVVLDLLVGFSILALRSNILR